MSSSGKAVECSWIIASGQPASHVEDANELRLLIAGERPTEG